MIWTGFPSCEAWRPMRRKCRRSKSRHYQPVTEGKRNDELWRQCMREAKSVDSFGSVANCGTAVQRNLPPPLDEREIVKIAQIGLELRTTGPQSVWPAWSVVSPTNP